MTPMTILLWILVLIAALFAGVLLYAIPSGIIAAYRKSKLEKEIRQQYRDALGGDGDDPMGMA